MNSFNLQNSFGTLGSKILYYRKIVLIFIILIVSFSIHGLSHLNISVSIEDFFLDDDPILQEQKEYKKYFKNNDFIGVLVESEDIFSRESLEVIHKVSKKLAEEVPFAKEVHSILNVSSPFLQKRSLQFKDGKLLASDRAIRKYKSHYSNLESLRGELFSHDNHQAWIQVKLSPYSFKGQENEEKNNVFFVGEQAYNIVQSIDSGNTRLTATGVPVYAHRKEKEMLDDLSSILIIGSIVAIILSILILQNITGVIGTLFVIICTVLIVFGIQGWMGMTIDSAFMAVPIFLTMGVSIGYTVHILRFFSINYATSKDRNESIIFALKKSGKPIFFTAFTTVAALLSFIVVKIKPIQWVGITSALSIIIVFILCMVLFPIILSFGKSKRNTIVVSASKRHFLEPKLILFSQWVEKYDNVLLLIFCIITAISLYGASNLKVDFNAEKMMGTELQHMKDQIYIGKSEIAKSDTIDLMLALDEESFDNPNIIQKIETLEKRINKLPLVKKTNSIVEVVKSSNYYIHSMNNSYKAIPSSKQDLKFLFSRLSRLAPHYFKSWMTDNYSKTRIFIELSDFSSLRIEKNIKLIKSYVKEIFPNNIKYSFSGSTYQMAIMNQYITKGLISSVFSALLMISIIMMLLFGSIKLGLIAMIPNIFPMIVAGGIMGYFNIPLEFVTMTIAPMIIGLAVDDTIHLFLHLKEELHKSNNFSYSLNCTFSSVGLAITETTLILCITFIIFLFSKVNNIIYMGVLTSAGLLAAYLTDIFISPVLIKKFVRISQKN